MNYRLDKKRLLAELGAWNKFLGRKIFLIACGGTAMTLLGIKNSTKDIDFMMPRERDHLYLIDLLKELGYESVTGSGWAKDSGFIFELFRGNRIHTTELLESPLEKGNHILIKEYSRIYLGVLNHYDLIISKLFRGTSVDFEDCLALFRAKLREIDIERLKNRYLETASFDVAEKRIVRNLDFFIMMLKKEKPAP